MNNLIAYFLQDCANSMANRICNDLPLVEIMPRVEDRRKLMRDFHEWNGDPEEYDSDSEYRVVFDFAIASYLAYLVRTGSKWRS